MFLFLIAFRFLNQNEIQRIEGAQVLAPVFTCPSKKEYLNENLNTGDNYVRCGQQTTIIFNHCIFTDMRVATLFYLPKNPNLEMFNNTVNGGEASKVNLITVENDGNTDAHVKIVGLTVTDFTTKQRKGYYNALLFLQSRKVHLEDIKIVYTDQTKSRPALYIDQMVTTSCNLYNFSCYKITNYRSTDTNINAILIKASCQVHFNGGYFEDCLVGGQAYEFFSIMGAAGSTIQNITFKNFNKNQALVKVDYPVSGTEFVFDGWHFENINTNYESGTAGISFVNKGYSTLTFRNCSFIKCTGSDKGPFIINDGFTAITTFNWVDCVMVGTAKPNVDDGSLKEGLCITKDVAIKIENSKFQSLYCNRNEGVFNFPNVVNNDVSFINCSFLDSKHYNFIYFHETNFKGSITFDSITYGNNMLLGSKRYFVSGKQPKSITLRNSNIPSITRYKEVVEYRLFEVTNADCQILIENTTVSSTPHALSKGFLLSTSSGVSIRDSNFTDLTFTTGKFISCNGTNVEIANCYFQNINCNDGYFITFTEANDDATKDISVIIQNCNFSNIPSSKLGGSISIYLLNPENLNEMKFQNLIFLNCESSVFLQFSQDKPLSNCLFENITSDNILITVKSQNNIPEITVDHFIFRNVSCTSQYGGGCPFWASGFDKVTFTECEWHNNHALHEESKTDQLRGNHQNGEGGGLQFGYHEDLYDTELEFTECKFTNNTADSYGGALAVLTIKPLTIVNCEFINNQAGLQDIANERGYGGALYISSGFTHSGLPKSLLLEDKSRNMMPTVDITGSKFINNNAKDGHAIYVRGCQDTKINFDGGNIVTDNGHDKFAIVCDSPNIELGDVIFNYTDPSSASDPIDFAEGSNATWRNHVFSNKSNPSSGKGNSIHVKRNLASALIDNCTFIDCGTSGYVITVYSAPFTIINSRIIFNNSANACSGIGIFKSGTITVNGCHFVKCKNDTAGEGSAGILYQPENTNTRATETFTLNNSRFEQMTGKGYCCINLIVSSFSTENITIINNKDVQNTCLLKCKEDVKFNKWIFSHNSISSESKGGSGLVINSAESSSVKIEFSSCEWTLNKATSGDGGAFVCGSTKENAKIGFTFRNCTFSYNRASAKDSQGGALSIKSTQDCSIENCTFIDNGANKCGGAIYINTDAYTKENGDFSIKIEKCHFTENNGGSDGHAIYCTGSSAVSIAVDNKCTFINNGANTGSTVYSSSPNFDIKNCQFNITVTLMKSKSRGITLSTTGTVELENLIFDGCQTIQKSDEHGGAILLKSPNDNSQVDEYSIKNCQFINCKAVGNGGAIYINSNVQELVLQNTIFTRCSAPWQGQAIYIGPKVQKVNISNDIKFINITGSWSIILSECPDFIVNGLTFKHINEEDYMAKAIFVRGGNADIQNVFFDRCRGGVEVGPNVESATIQNCIFSNCFDTFNGSVNTIHNKKCTFSNNIINYSSNAEGQSMRGIEVTSDGNIDISHNKLIKGRGYTTYSKPEINRGVLTVLCTQNKFNGELNIHHNVIQECGDVKSSVLYIDTVGTLKFEHNEINNCPISDYSMHIVNIPVSTFTFRNLTYKNSGSGSKCGGGLGIWITFKSTVEQNSRKIEFIGCTFENNTVKGQTGIGGAFSLGDCSNKLIEQTYQDCLFIENKAEKYGGALGFLSDAAFTIRNCTFLNNIAGSLSTNNNIKGGAIYVSGVSTGSIQNCTFTGNQALRDFHGNAIYIESSSTTKINISTNCQFIDNGNSDTFNGYTIVSNAASFEFTTNTVQFTDIKSSSSAILLSGSGSSKISSSFIKCNGANNNGNAIHIEQTVTSAIIENCNFKSCGNGNTKYTIWNEGKTTIINECNFTYSDDSKSAAIKVTSNGDHTITNCNIRNSDSNDGALYYNSSVSINGVTQRLVLQNIVFDSPNGEHPTALNLFLSFTNHDIDHITVQNSKSGKTTCLLTFNTINEFTFDNFVFKDNVGNQEFGGGSGLKINSENENEIKITFIDCVFQNNEAQAEAKVPDNQRGRGGALQIGFESSSTKLDLTFMGCEFTSNKAKYEGGAISLSTNYAVSIDNCTFIKNTSQDKGGALHINPDYNIHTPYMPSCTITGCKFDNNDATSGTAIYFMKGQETEIEIGENNQFNNNVANKNVIESECSHLLVHDGIFGSSEQEIQSNILFLTGKGNSEIHNCTFTRISMGNSNSLGSAIRVDSEVTGVHIHDCQFADCGKSGFAIRVSGSPLLFDNNTISCTAPQEIHGGLYINAGGKIEVLNSIFMGTNSNGDGKITSLFLQSTGEEEDITIQGLNFSKCLGRNLRCFNLNAWKPFTFSNINVSDSPLGNYLGGVSFGGHATSEDVFVFDNCKWYNNKCNSLYGGGSGLWLVNERQLMEMKFVNCEFNGNYHSGKGGAFHDGHSPTISNMKLNFQNCRFINNVAGTSGGALAIETTGNLVINGCSFTSNTAQIGGGAIFIRPEDNDHVTMANAVLTQNTFSDNVVNSTESIRGILIYIEKGSTTTITIEGSNSLTNKGEKGTMIYSECGNLQLNSATFDFQGNGTKSFRALELGNSSGTTISKCNFIGTSFPGQEGQAIYAHRANFVAINETKIIDCGSPGQNYYVIYSDSHRFFFEKSNLTFTLTTSKSSSSPTTTAATKSSPGIFIKQRSTVHLLDSTISNINSDVSKGGGLCYGTGSNGTLEDKCNLTIEGTTFQNIIAKNGRAIFTDSARFTTFRNCTIRDMPDGYYIVTIGHKSVNFTSSAVIEDVSFINNRCYVTDGGGGIGLWYSQVNKLILSNCRFIGNVLTASNANGGALGYAVSGNITMVELEFSNCFFKDNQVQEGCNGSALYISSASKPVSILDCQFNYTIASALNGGAIYIESNCKDVLIDGCDFTGMKIKGNGKGHAIYINNMMNTVKINDCRFVDNYHQYSRDISVIYSVGKSLELTGSTITFSKASYSTSCRGLLVFSRSSLIVRDTLFENCWIEDQAKKEWGAGLCYSNHETFLHDFKNEYVELDHVTFDNCECPNGRALYGGCTTESHFSFVTIQNNTHRTENIITWSFSKSPISYCKLDQCSFINLSSNAVDGGGCGLWMGDVAVTDFYICKFQNIVSGTNGGAFSFYENSRLKKQSFVFYKCLFDNNKAADNCKGGALYIQITGTVNITNCNFTSNTVKGSGAAIYITNTCSQVYMDNTEFHHNTENVKGRGNAISLATGLKLVTINKCTFVDCGTTGCTIESNSTDLTIQESKFRFTKYEVGSRGIRIFETSILNLLNSTFYGCHSTEPGLNAGGGVYYDGLKNTQQQESINIIGTTFENNTAQNGCAMLLNINEVPVLKDNIFKNHQCGKFILSVFENSLITEDITLDNCVFENNKFTSATESNPDGGGSGIWIAPKKGSTDSSFQIVLKDCRFKDNECNLYGGAIAYGESSTLRNALLTFTGCTFENNHASGKTGGALWINTAVLCIIEGCTFMNNNITNSKEQLGNALYFGSRSLVMIIDSVIHNNGDSGSCIVFDGKEISMEDTTVSFDFTNVSSRGIHFRNKAVIDINECTFTKCSGRKSGNKGWGGALLFQEDIQTNNQFSITIEQTVFDNNTAANGAALLINSSTVPIVQACTIKNHQEGDYIFSIFFTIYQMVFELTDCIFEANSFHNSKDKLDSGGSGIWISNAEEIAQGRLIQIYMSGTIFRNNVAPYYGGAFAYGQSRTVVGTELYFNGCTFDGNTAEGGQGGALYLITRAPYEIQYCTFRNNVAAGENGQGGSIMIDTPAPIVTISFSSFIMETAIGGGNSIYVAKQSAHVLLSDNAFVDCGISKDVVTIESIIGGIDGNRFEFTTTSESCRALNIRQSGTFEIKNNHFIRCQADNGACVIYTNEMNGKEEEVLSFLENTFEGCLVTGKGCAMYLRVKDIPTFVKNTIKSCKGGFLNVYIQFTTQISEFVIDEWNFEQNYHLNSQNKEDGGGSGFWVENSNSQPINLTFQNCQFTKNVAAYAGGALSYGRSSIFQNSFLTIENCVFNSNNVKGEYGGALWIGTKTELFINNCNFTNNKALGVDSYGGAIYFDESSTTKVTIQNTFFTKNSAIDSNVLHLTSNLKTISIENCELINNGNLGSNIKSYSSELIISNSFIGFDAYSLTNRGIEILSKSKLIVNACNISYCNAGKGEGGGIYYKVTNGTQNEESITIENTTFTNCKGTNGVALMLWTTYGITFNNNTIKDCRNGAFICSVIVSDYVDNFDINDCTFRHNMKNNPTNSEDGGGSGIWMANSNKTLGRYCAIKFNNCKFIENTARNVGGAFAYGRSATIYNTKLEFNTCTFSDNNAKGKEAGALWLCTIQPILIIDCIFKRNKATGTGAYGGAIVIDSNSTSINIQGCTFDNNKAKDGNAIYIKKQVKDINITECTIDNCGTYGSVINVESKSCNIDTCYIKFTQSTASCRGINFTTKCIASVRDTHFINCKTTGEGGGILYDNVYQTTDSELLLIEGCLFENCQGGNGAALLARLTTPIHLRNNLFWRQTNGKFIISVFYTSYINETIVEDCYFEHNSFTASVSSTDGGGSGIWIANAKGLSPPGSFEKLTFIGCTWTNNTANTFGGALAYGDSLTLKEIILDFSECNFVENHAKLQFGGALYIVTNNTLTISDCFFDGNTAAQRGGALYFSKSGNVEVRDSKFARNKADLAGAIYCDGRNKVIFDSLIINDNFANNKSPSLAIVNLGGNEDIEINNCKFNFNRVVGQTQIEISGSNPNSTRVIRFNDNCFTHSGDEIETSVTHIESTMTDGSIIFNKGNCFDLIQARSINVQNDTNLEIPIGIFNCQTCSVPNITSLPPTNLPTASPAPTPEPTPLPTGQLPDPTPKPTLTTETPVTRPSETLSNQPTTIPSIQPTTNPSTSSGNEPETNTVDQSSTDKDDTNTDSGNNRSKKIGLIAGIVIAILVIVIVIIVLIWMLVINRNSNNNNLNDDSYPTSTTQSNEINTDENNEEQIWDGNEVYQSQENPLFDGEGDGEDEFDEDQMNNDFEESWG